MTDDGLRDKLARQGEETLGRLAQELLENPLVSGALTRAFEARERAVQAQEVAMGALNLPSAADVERLTRRIRSVAQRLEGIEDGLDRLDRRLEGLGGGTSSAADERLAAIESRLDDLRDDVRALAAGSEKVGGTAKSRAGGSQARRAGGSGRKSGGGSQGKRAGGSS